jgi:hypothetical protein
MTDLEARKGRNKRGAFDDSPPRNSVLFASQ